MSALRLGLVGAVAAIVAQAAPALAQGPPAGADTTILLPQEIGTLRVGETRRGRLEAGDWSMGDGTWADVWYFQATAGQRVVIELRSREFDAYLQLLDPSGRRLAHDDDGAGNKDARITFTVREAGRYQVVVNNFGDEPRQGLYTVALR